MENDIRLTWIDAWLLLSILYSKKQDNTFEWKCVIGTGDVINHSIFNYEEINAGVEKLVLTGYLSVIGSKILVTDKAIKLLKDIEVKEGTASPLERYMQLEKELDVIPYSTVPYGINYESNSKYSKGYITIQEYQNATKNNTAKFFKKLLNVLESIKGKKDS